MDERFTIVKGNLKSETLVFFIFKFISGILGLVAISIRTHFIEKSIYGNFVLITNSVALIISLAITWVVESAGRYYEKTDNKTVYFTTYLINFVFSYFLGIGLVFLVNIFNGNNLLLAYFPLTISLLFVNGLVNLFYQVFRMSHKTVVYGLTITVSSILNVVVFLLLPKTSGVVTLLLTLITMDIVVILIAFFTLKLFKYFRIKSFSWDLTKKSLKYALPLVVVWGCLWIFNSSDLFIINFFMGKENVGYVAIYSMAHSLSNQSIGIIVSSLTFAVFPRLISQYLNNDFNSISKAITEQVDVCTKICVPAIIGLTALCPLIYSSIINASYNTGGSGRLLVFIFSLTITFSGVENLVIRPWQLDEKTHYMMIIYAISAVLNIALDFLFVYLFGFIAAAIVSCSIVFLRMLAIYVIMYKKKKIHFKVSGLLVAICASMFMMACLERIIYITNNVYVNIILSIFCGVVI